MRYRLAVWGTRHGRWIGLLILFALIGGSIYLSEHLQTFFEARYADDKARESIVEAFRALLLNLGGPLIGAVAIVSSLVLFALQVNVERMPHQLFRRFSVDPSIMAYFAAAFFLAVGVLAESLWVSKATIAPAVLLAFWAAVLTLVAFWFAYDRAMTLISPRRQLDIIARDARRTLTAAATRARRTRPLLEHLEPKKDPAPFDATHDVLLTFYYRQNPRWTASAVRAIDYAIAFARRYAERGDYEISNAALNVIVSINQAYIVAKGKTFYSDGVLDSGFSTDGLFNASLEHLRQLVQVGLARGDEQQLEQVLGALGTLAHLYCQIDYSTPWASKAHASLAAGYLADAVDSVLPQKMTDVAMRGLRVMGSVAAQLAVKGQSETVVSLGQRIARIACVGFTSETRMPIADVGVAQLANLTWALLHNRSDDIRFATTQVRASVDLVAKFYLQQGSESAFGIHTPLGAYYSQLHNESLIARLIGLANHLANRDADDKEAGVAIRNVVAWSDDIDKSVKEILLAAVAAKSRLTFDVLSWIAEVCDVLMVVALSAASDSFARDSLRKHARDLVYVLSWIPDDGKSVSYVENSSLTRTLFEIGVSAHRFESAEVLEAVLRRVLLGWVFKGGGLNLGWAILERGLTALATLALLAGNEFPDLLKADVRKRLSASSAPDDEQRARAADELRSAAHSLGGGQYSIDPVDHAARTLDPKRRAALFEDLAEILAPAKKREDRL